MKRPAVFFDRDNTLIVSDGYLGDPAKVVLVDGAAEAVARVRQLGFATVVFSNQSGVARGMFGEDAVHAVNSRMDEQLLDASPGAVIDRHEFCSFHPEATVEAYRQDSPLRKPRPGMILQAAEKLALDLSRSWVVGDAPRDVEAGHAAGCRTILVKDASLPPSPAANSASDVEPSFVVGSLREAVATIARETQGPAADEAAPENQPAQEEASAPRAELVMTLAPEPGKPAHVHGPARTMSIVPESRREPDAPRRQERAPAPPASPAPAPAREDAPAAPIRKEPPAPGPTARDLTAAITGTTAPIASPEPSPPRRPVELSDPAPSAGNPSQPVSTEGIEALLEQILMELRRQGEHEHSDFSVSKLMAGIIQPVALAVLFFAYFREGQAQLATLVTALVLQTFTVALLIMGRQR